MLALERHRTILNLLETQGSVRVSDLAETFELTEETIRRDLEKLEKQGELLRSHGGAILSDQQRHEIPFAQRETTNHGLKCRIAAAAIEQLSAEDTIVLDASSTTYQMAKLLPDMPLTVITNSLPILNVLVNHAQIDLIATGGLLDAGSCSFTGNQVDRIFSTYHINKAFISSKGVNAQKGLSEIRDIDAGFKEKLIPAADKTFLLVDSSKFSINSKIYFSPISNIDVIITDDGAETTTLSKIRDLGPEVIAVA